MSTRVQTLPGPCPAEIELADQEQEAALTHGHVGSLGAQLAFDRLVVEVGDSCVIEHVFDFRADL